MPRRCTPPLRQPQHTYYKQDLLCMRFGQHTWQKGSAIVPALRFLRRSVGVALCIASRLSLASVPPSCPQIAKLRSQDLAEGPRSAARPTQRGVRGLAHVLTDLGRKPYLFPHSPHRRQQ